MRNVYRQMSYAVRRGVSREVDVLWLVYDKPGRPCARRGETLGTNDGPVSTCVHVS